MLNDEKKSILVSTYKFVIYYIKQWYRPKSYYFRIHLILIIAVAMFAILYGKLIFFPFSDSRGLKVYTTMASKHQRGDIMDRNGVVLATNITSYDLYLEPAKMFDIEGDIIKIVKIIPLTKSQIETITKQIYKKRNTKNRILVKRNISWDQKSALMDDGVIGLSIDPGSKRFYVHNNDASHILGLISDGKGIAGMEYFYDDTLSKGISLKLAIDIKIQTILREMMMRAIEETDSTAGVALISNIKTGEIISAVSLPDFNPNDTNDRDNNKLFNRFSLGIYELGSVFKLFLAAMSSELGLSWTKLYHTTDSLKIGAYTIHDYGRKEKNMSMNIPQIIAKSSNLGCAAVITEIGEMEQVKFMKKLGFFERLDIELPEIGLPRTPDPWPLSSAITVTYGYGLAVSPLQYVNAASSILHGSMLKSTFIKVNKPSDIKVIRNNIVSKSTFLRIRKLMRNIVLNEMVREKPNDIFDQYDIGGKTGTAMLYNKKGYDMKKYNMSVFFALPTADPEYAIYILLERPALTKQNMHHFVAGYVVVPVAKKIIERIGPMLNVSSIKVKKVTQ